MGPTVEPFERVDFKRKVLEGEDLTAPFEHLVYDATENSFPSDVILAEANDIINENAKEATYLWVIDNEGLRIIPENTPNEKSSRKVVCHTNLTGGKNALQGGELWFGKDNHVYVNNKSGRYGCSTIKQREAIIEYFKCVGYKNVIQLR
ncbi:hypothetical protein VB776_09710 [Arcicella sp. DC2W]|uniref:Uncharacterized protein n=1 Tax=Arcicella gelida TaxID=2984195 RepID=A0ABU5S3W3_9BACT|nr:hypothetical protein [Arcicella sp. DC2W]MEA5403189.1 hypothetical protein [Arcicella sp. DC2W]